MTVVSAQEHEAELPERWRAKAKTDVVLRLLRGESVDAVSQAPAALADAERRYLNYFAQPVASQRRPAAPRCYNDCYNGTAGERWRRGAVLDAPGVRDRTRNWLVTAA